MYFSKSKYTTLWQCPKAVWLKKYKPEESIIDAGTLARMNAGNVVGDLAMGLFGDFTEVTVYKGDKIDLSSMIVRTKEEIAKGTENICEASFEYNGLYCAVDILRKTSDGYAIYEVKSSTMSSRDDSDPKEVYTADIAYQKYVLEKCGINVTDTFLVVLDKEYIFDGSIELDELFLVVDVAKEVANQYLMVEENLKIAEELLECEDEPPIDLDCRCKAPYLCSFWQYCTKHIPQPSVFDLYRMPFKKKIALYHQGLISYSDIQGDKAVHGNLIRSLQVSHVLNGIKDASIDRDIINDFLDTISYPLYHLDFETEQPVIPKYIGTHPYQQIPFQYSLHIEEKDGNLTHKEFLAESGPDPRRAIAESLVRDIPSDVCVLAYNKAFECTRLKELAEAFPDLSVHLLSIADNIVDLLIPFSHGGYYMTEMGGSFSIKSVLPALFPDDPELDYHALDGVHNGAEAMTIFPQIQFMEPKERERARNNLLKYCCLDTLAMVKVLGKLRENV